MGYAEIAAGLGKCARAALPVIPHGPPGLPWFDIIDAAPRISTGRIMSHYHALRPLLLKNLLHCQHQPYREDGTRDFDRYWLTRDGVLVRNAITMEDAS